MPDDVIVVLPAQAGVLSLRVERDIPSPLDDIVRKLNNTSVVRTPDHRRVLQVTLSRHDAEQLRTAHQVLGKGYRTDGDSLRAQVCDDAVAIFDKALQG